MQHHNSIVVGWLFLFHYEADLVMWAEWFLAVIKKILKRKVLFWIIVKLLFNGNKEKSHKDRKKGVLCKTSKKDCEAVKDALRKILESKNFQNMHREEIRLIPKYDGKGVTCVKESVVKSIQCQQVEMKGAHSHAIYSFRYADTNNANLKLSPREIIVQMKEDDGENFY